LDLDLLAGDPDLDRDLDLEREALLHADKGISSCERINHHTTDPCSGDREAERDLE
jgi:hypothetical protein